MSAPGSLGAWRARQSRAPVADAGRLVGEGALVVIAPHPDDETFGCSTLLLSAARDGREVAIVALTDGDHSHPGSRSVPPSRLAAIRRTEQERAVALLGHPTPTWLRLALPDGAAGRDPRFADALDRVAQLCERIGATALAAPHPDDPHPDHHAAAAMALALRDRLPGLRILFYEVWTARLDDTAPIRSEDLHPFRLRTDGDRKAQAIAAHRSQLGEVVSDDPEGFVLPDWFLDRQREPIEHISWLAVSGEPPPAEHFRRLYADGADPWGARDAPYEVDKRERILALLGERCFRRSLEAGCGEGHLSGLLRLRGVVEEAVGIDREPAVVERARATGWAQGISFQTGSLPADLPAGPFDLVVLAEILYYLDEAGLALLAERLRERLVAGALVAIVSYRGRTDTALGSLQAADLLVALLGEQLVTLRSVNHPRDRMELLEWLGEVPAVPEGEPGDPIDAAASV